MAKCLLFTVGTKKVKKKMISARLDLATFSVLD